MTKTFFIEANFSGVTHKIINKSFLGALELAFPDSPIQLIADESHVRNICPQESENIHSFTIDYEREQRKISRSGWNFYLAPFKRFITLSKMFKKANFKSGDRLFFASNNEYDLLFGFFFSKLFPSSEVVFVCHANLNEIHSWKSRNPARSFFDYETSIKRLAGSRVKLLCLEDHIEHNLVKTIPDLKSNVYVIHHPIDSIDTTHSVASEKMTLCFVGILSKEKHPEKFAELTERMDGSKFCSSVAGWSPSQSTLEFKDCISYPSNSQLSHFELEERLRGSDFICVFHDDSYYSLSGSGVIIDAIKYCKPIVYLESKLITNLEKVYGHIGVTGSNILEIAQKLNSVSQQDIDNMKFNLKKIQQDRYFTKSADKLIDLYNFSVSAR